MKIDLSALSEEQRNALLPVFQQMNEQLEAQREQIAGLESGGSDDEVKALKAEIESLKATIKEAGTPPKKEAETDPEPKGTASEVAEAIKALTDKVDGLLSERDSEKKTATAQQLAEKVVADKYPNASEGQKKSLIRRITSMAPADEDAAINAGKEVITEWTDAGVKVEGIAADSSKEGKKDTPEPGSKEAHMEAIKNRRRTGASF